MDYILLEI